MIFANVIQDAFAPLISLFEGIMVFIHNHLVGGSWGLAIVGLTVLIRAILVPLTYRQLKSMQEMQRLAPQMQEIKERYKDDKQRQQQELMKFYQENKINPLASCLPLLLQLPVFISLFYMLRTDLKKHICPEGMIHAYNQATHKMVQHIGEVPVKFVGEKTCNEVQPHSAKFLFIPDITDKATGIVLVVLIVLYVASQLGSTLIATASADPNQRRLMLLLPVVFVVILFRYPAGLLVYWITTNVWTIGQQSIIRRRLPPPPRPAKAKDDKPRSSLKQLLAGAAGTPEPGVAGASGGGASAGGGSERGNGSGSNPAAPPPRPPRKKKKRSGRRR
ncbi:MAG TPA: YidC/Oxa1 family membrane protein insertase [Solirubrobacteraceae bacterium]|nr:YidC/Oxa1 family membrane protein insertase [Solirubrobacteraceae bacterium]